MVSARLNKDMLWINASSNELDELNHQVERIHIAVMVRLGVCSYCLLDSITPTPNLFAEMDIAHYYLYFSDLKSGLNMFSSRCPKCQEQWHWIALLLNCTCSHQLLTSFMFLIFVKIRSFSGSQNCLKLNPECEHALPSVSAVALESSTAHAQTSSGSSSRCFCSKMAANASSHSPTTVRWFTAR